MQNQIVTDNKQGSNGIIGFVKNVEDLPNEIWKPIDWLNGMYLISNIGRVKSLQKGKVKILVQSINVTGYFVCRASIKNIKKTIRVHREVANLFIDNIENKPQVNHKNCIKLDNRVDNLEWCTPKENKTHAIQNGKYKYFSGKDNFWFGKKKTEEMKEKFRQAKLGKKASEETKLKMSLSKKYKSKFAVKIKNIITNEIYGTIAEAADKNNISRGSLQFYISKECKKNPTNLIRL